MKTSTPNYAQLPLSGNFQTLLESENTLMGILSKTMENLLKIQFQAIAAGITENLSSLAPDPPPSNPAHLVWQWPSLLKLKAQRRVGNWLDSFATLSQGQQKVLEWGCQSWERNAEQMATAVSQVNGIYFSRRQSAELIDFAERRSSTSLVEKFAEVPHGKNRHRATHQAAA